jgi:type II secretory pathway pseudopilin PulG
VKYLARTNVSHSGMTIVELLVVISATGIITTAVLAFAFNFWRVTYSQQASLDSLTTRLNAGDSLRSLLSSSSGMITQTSIPDPNAMNPDVLNANYWEIIHAVPGQISANPGETIPVVYFKRFSFDAANNILFNVDTPYENEYVLYLDGTDRQLYLRTLANPSATGTSLMTSCPEALAGPTCPADRIIAEDIDSIDMRYFSRTGNLVDYTGVVDSESGEFIGPDFPAAEVVEFTLNITRRPPFQASETIRVNTVIRVALRN